MPQLNTSLVLRNVVAIAALAIMGCALEDSFSVDTVETVVALEPVRDSVGLTVGQTDTLEIILRNAGGQGRPPRNQLIWETSNPRILAVTNDGAVTSIGEGAAVVSARLRGRSLSTSVEVTAFRVLRSVAVGGSHTCSITNDKKLACWGANNWGQIGNGSTISSSTPQFVSLSFEFDKVVAGASHSCALSTSGTILCWGRNDGGQAGINSASRERISIPREVNIGEIAIDVTAGEHFSCALTTRSEVRCWGENFSGQLGDGTLMGRKSNRIVTLPGPVNQLEAYFRHSCALVDRGLSNQETWCWGNNQFSQLGFDGFDEVTPFGVAATSPRRNPFFIETLVPGSGQLSTCHLSGGGVGCWGAPPDGPRDYSLGSGIRTASMGAGHVCVLKNDSAAYCQGPNLSGELGNGDLLPRDSLTLVSSESSFDVIEAGWQTSCGITSAGQLWCWGKNDHGQLGNGTRLNASKPTKVSWDQ